MCIECQYKVAKEFGFSKFVIRLCQSTHVFKTAGDLVDYLDRHEESLEKLVKENENAEKQKKTERLRRETECLYRETLCVVCLQNSRKLMVLPCAHFCLCERCEKKFFVCPFQDCKEPISCVIRVRF